MTGRNGSVGRGTAGAGAYRARSKVDAWLAVVAGGALILSLSALGPLLHSGTAADRVGAFVTVAILALVTCLTVPTHYTLAGDVLTVRSGVVRWRIPLDSIRRLSPTHNPLASPAWSLDRIAVEYGTPGTQSRTILISPVGRDAFMERLGRAAGLSPHPDGWTRNPPGRGHTGR